MDVNASSTRRAGRRAWRTTLVLDTVLLVFIVCWLGPLTLPGTAQAAGGQQVWARLYDGSRHLDDVVVDVALGPAGSVYALTVADGGQWAGAEPRPVLERRSSAGRLLWRASFHISPGQQQLWSLAVDAAGNVYATGADEQADWSAVLTVKFDKDGHLTWMREYPTSPAAFSAGREVAVDTAGNCYVLAAGPPSAGANEDMVVLKYSLTGVRRWTRSCGLPGIDASAVALVVDGAGNAYAGGVSTIAGNKRDWLVVKLDTTGAVRWTRTVTTAGDAADQLDGLATAPSGADLYASGTVEVGGVRKACVVKFSSSGVRRWSRTYWGPRPNCDWGSLVTVDPFGDVVFTATTNDPALSWGWAVMKVSAVGKRLWLRAFDQPAAEEHVQRLATDSTGTVYAVGTAGPPGHGQAVAAKYSATGARRWLVRYQSQASSGSDARCVTVRSEDGVYLGGYSADQTAHLDALLLKLKP